MSFTRYHPTHVINVHPVYYPYRLWSECTQQYVGVNTEFIHDDMTNYNWNYMDQYIVRDQDCLNLIDVSLFKKRDFGIEPASRRSNVERRRIGGEIMTLMTIKSYRKKKKSVFLILFLYFLVFTILENASGVAASPETIQ